MDYSSYDVSQYARGMEDYASYSDSSVAAAGLGAAFGAMIGIYFVIAIVIAVLQIVAMWKIFTKAGEAGWKSIIPIYNVVTLFKVSGLSPWLVLAYLAAAIPFVGWLIVLALTIFQANGLSKAFGKSTGFTVGLILIPSIFYLILGLGSSEYTGKSDI